MKCVIYLYDESEKKMDFGFYVAKIKSKIFHNRKIMNDFYRKKGVKIGDGCLICSNIATSEAFLISIGNNCTISTNVSFITHDYSAHIILEGTSDLYGKISIGDNCFIGANSTLLYGVTLGNNILVAAGSIVTKSFTEENIIIAGNPARIIGTWDEYRKKYANKATPPGDVISFHDLCQELKSSDKYLIKR